MFSLTWLKDALERAIKTAAQMALTMLGADKLDILHVDWATVLGLSGGAAVISILMSVLSAGGGNPGTASVTNAIQAAPRHELRDPSSGTKLE